MVLWLAQRAHSGASLVGHFRLGVEGGIVDGQASQSSGLVHEGAACTLQCFARTPFTVDSCLFQKRLITTSLEAEKKWKPFAAAKCTFMNCQKKTAC